MENTNAEGMVLFGESKRLPGADRHLTITPLDMRQGRFGTAMRGFNREEVTAFLQEAAADYEEALKENERLKQEVTRLEAALAQFRNVEGSLSNTLMSAQRMADEMREKAAQEAARAVSEGEAKAEELVKKSQLRIGELNRDIETLKAKRREAEASIDATISILRNTLSFVREQEEHERDERVLQHRPRLEVTSQTA